MTLDNPSESYRGWHGGPTISESKVPLMVAMPGRHFTNDAGADLPQGPEKFRMGAEAALTQITAADAGGFARNWHLSRILSAGVEKLRETPATP